MTKQAKPRKLWNVLFSSGVISLFTRAEQRAASPELMARRQSIKAVMPRGIPDYLCSSLSESRTLTQSAVDGL